MIYNLEKLREVHCRKIVCLQKEVPQGIATVQSCDNLFELMECQYFTGPFLEILPSGLWNTLGDALKGAFSSPVGLVAGLTELVACAAGCWVQHGSSVMLPCKAVKFINQILDIVNTVVGLVKNRPDVTGAPYCDMVEDLDKAKDKKTTTAPVKSTTGTTGAKVVSTTGGTSGSTGRTPTSGTAPTTSKSVPLTSSTATTGGTTK